MRLKSIIKVNIFFSISIPIFLLILLDWISLNMIMFPRDSLSIQRYIFLIFLIGISITITFFLIHIKIRNLAYDEVLSEQYFRKGRLIIKLSHHNTKLLHHEIKIGKYYICTGCFGTAIGLLIGKILVIIYVFNFNSVFHSIGIILIFSGLIVKGITYLKYVKPIFSSNRLFVNACFPIGIWLVIIGIDIYFRNIFAIFYCLIAIPYFCFQRIYLTKLNHKDELLHS